MKFKKINNLIDQAKYHKEIARIEPAVSALTKKVTNEKFLSNARPDVIEKEKTRLNKLTQELNKYKEAMDANNDDEKLSKLIIGSFNHSTIHVKFKYNMDMDNIYILPNDRSTDTLYVTKLHFNKEQLICFTALDYYGDHHLFIPLLLNGGILSNMNEFLALQVLQIYFKNSTAQDIINTIKSYYIKWARDIFD